MNKNPNILFIMCDQLRAFETGCYGNTYIKTPNIDRLAEQGVRFETAVTNYPVCMAARSVVLSGQYNRHCTGGVSNVGSWDADGHLYMPQYPVSGRPHLKDPTLAEILRSLGYQTSIIGKWHIHSWPQDIGFDEYLIPRVHHCHSGQHYTQNGAPEFVPPGYSVDFEADQVEDFIRRRTPEDQPFFLFYSISPPHCPLSDAPDKYLNMYDPELIPIRSNVDLDTPLQEQDYWFKIYRWDFRFYNFRLPYTEILPEEYTLRKVIAEYYGLTTWVDDAVGRALNALDASGLAENTIVIFTSDHGDYLGSHGRVQKGDLHEESIRIPFIIRWTNHISPGIIKNQAASLVDLLPTINGFLQVDIPRYVDGKDLSSAILGNQETSEGSYAIIETSSGAGIRTSSHLLGTLYQSGTHQLPGEVNYFYDLQKDPYQLNNLAEQVENDPLAQSLLSLLEQWDAKTSWSQSEAA